MLEQDIKKIMISHKNISVNFLKASVFNFHLTFFKFSRD